MATGTSSFTAARDHIPRRDAQGWARPSLACTRNFLSGIIFLLTSVFSDADNSRRSLPLLVGPHTKEHGLSHEDKEADGDSPFPKMGVLFDMFGTKGHAIR
jgi:hypothetical protein